MNIQVPTFNAIRALVVGDVMLDRYWSGTTARISPEAPVPVVRIQSVSEHPGGAGNVALNLVALGAQVDLLGFCGEDQAGDSLEEGLCKAGVTCFLQRIPRLRTTTKLRILSLNQQLIRLDFEDLDHGVDPMQLKRLFEERLKYVDLVILSDYAKGCLAHVQDLIQGARRAGKPVFVDPKRNVFDAYRGATLVTPNRREFEAIVGPCEDEQVLVQKGLKLLKAHDFQALLVTRGEQGMTLLQRDHAGVHLHAFTREVYDVTGAGDTTIACLALAYVATDGDLLKSAQLANLAASIAVSKIGAAAVTPAELRRVLQNQQFPFHRGILSEMELKVAVEDAKTCGEKIVMTSGCFDILHAGHVNYLRDAKCLGDRLVVAVNDDVSVKQLKGAGRPINSLVQRMTVLTGLDAVDWVIPFSDTTPERLIRMIAPDIWVKGGDYSLKDLPEAEAVQACGGQVQLLDFVAGCSTSAIIRSLQRSEP